MSHVPASRPGKLSAAAFSILLAMALQPASAWSQDTTDPQLVSLSISPATFDTAAGPVTITVTAGVDDAESGFVSGLIDLTPSAVPCCQRSLVSFDPSHRISGDAQSGVYEVSVVLPQFSAGGTWAVSGLLVDAANNVSNYLPADFVNLGFLGSIHNDATVGDSTPPELVEFTVSPTAVDTTAQAVTITITARITDALTGYHNGFAVFAGTGTPPPPPTAPLQSTERVSGDAQDGVYETTLVLPQGSALGLWSIWVILNDGLDNRRDYSTGQLDTAGFDSRIGNRCGNGTLEPEETCDAGLLNGPFTSCCSVTCQLQPAGSPCPDDDDACTSNLCDSGGACIHLDTCSVGCGNGIVEADEQCDDGNPADCDSCSNACRTVSGCGDGATCGSEECDDGNIVSGDGCTATCQSQVCGDGAIRTPELCDDGNVADGDGCQSDCTLTPQVVSEESLPGVPVSTDTGGGVTPLDPFQTSVTTPVGGAVTINETGQPPAGLPGYDIVGIAIQITAPAATPEAPLDFRFTIDASRVPAGETALTLVVLRNGVAVPDCTAGASGGAAPDPCVAERIALEGGNVQLRVFTSAASEWSFAVDTGCAQTPRADCRSAGSSTVLVKDHSTNTKDLMKWKWGKGAATTIAEISDPTGDGRYDLCLYPNAGGLVGETFLPAATGWSFDDAKRYRYKDAAGSSGGVTSIDLTSGIAEHAGIKVMARGAALPDGLLPSVTTSFAVQLVDTQKDICWGSTFPTGVAKPGQFKGKASN